MGTITVTLNTEIYNLLLKLAGEDEKEEGEFLENIIRKEDIKRHTRVVPFEGEKRFKCFRKKCFETEKESTDVVELGN